MKNDRFELKEEDTEHNSTVSRDGRFGYLGFSPRWLQFLNNPWCFLLGITGLSFGQALAILGVLPLVMPEIEKRFNFSSSQIGMIAAANDVAAVVFGLIVSHYGNFGNKVKWIGFGGIITGLGFLILTLPHYIIGKYSPPEASSFPGILCNTPTTLTSSANITTTTPNSCNVDFIADWYYLAVFVLGQFFSGLGSISLFSLTPSIFFKSCNAKILPIFIGLWQFSMFLGSMVAFGLTGPLLALYVDIKQPEGFNMTPRDPRWIGNWWIGILGSAAICFISSIFLLGFPGKIKNNSAQERHNLEKGVLPNLTVKEKLKKLPSVLKELLTNWTFLFNSLAMNTSLLYGGGLAPFFAKILILRYGVEPEKVGQAIIISTIPPLLIGLLVGSLLPRVFKLEESGRKSAFFCFLFQIITVIGPFAFLVPGCEEVKLAGWQVPYGVRTSIGDSYQFTEYPSIPGVQLGSTCNQNCGCHLGIAPPVCGADNVSYLSPCYAGCTGSLSMTTFGNCSCIASNDGFGGAARIGSCDQNCKNWILFLVLMSVVSLAIFLQLTPSKVVLMRCLRPEDLSFAFGLQYFSSKVLAHIPGPVLFGHVVDLNCVIWQKVCDEIGYCLVYDMDEQMKMITTITGILTGLGTLFYMLSWLLYKEAKQAISKDKNKTPLLESVIADENMKETKL